MDLLPEPGSEELERARLNEGANRRELEPFLKQLLVPHDIRVSTVPSSPSESNSKLLLVVERISEAVNSTCLILLLLSMWPKPKKSRNTG